MKFRALDDETYATLLGILICNLEVDIKSSLFQSDDFLKPYGDGGKSIAIGFGLDLKVNSLTTITNLYKKIFGNDWQISNEEKDILEKLRANKITPSQALEAIKNLATLSLDLKTQDNAYRLFSLTLQTYENKVDNKISKSYERIALVSRAYNHYGELLQKAVRQQNRFLIWFYLRYTINTSGGKELLGLTKRRWWESEIFKLYDDEIFFEDILEIFQNLHIIKFNNKKLYQYIKEYETRNLTQKNIQTFKSDSKSRELDERFEFTYDDITTTLKPHLDYLNTLTQKTFSLENIYCIQSFYGNLGAKKLTNVASINKILSQRFPNSPKQPQPTQDSHTNPQTNNAQINPNERILATTQDSTTQTNLAQSTPLQDNTQSRLSQTNHTDNPTAQERVANPAQSTNENPTQILILYPKATPLPIQIIQPENTFLTLVVGKNAKLDCSKLLLDKCEIHYLQYDENQEESTENPKITALKTDSELTLTTKDSNLYEVIHNGIIYYISKNEGVLRVALGQDREEVIELYNFAKENEYRILKDCASQILDIQLKLQDNKELPTSHNGNFALTINNLTLLDKNGKNLDIAEDYTLYLHNCENRIIYENTSIQKNTDDTYRVNFSFDLIQDEDSNFFKRTTKLIIATQNLSNDFSTSEIHTKGNVAVVSLSSADKKGGNYTFTKKVSAQEFESQIINARKEYLASLDSLAYEGSREKDWFVILKDELYLIEAEVAFFTKEAFQNAYVRESYNKSIQEMSNQLLKEVEKEQDIHKRKILAKQLAQDANKFRNEIMNDMRAKSTTWGRVRAERIKSRGKTFEEMIEKKIKDLSYNKPFEQLTKQEQTKVFEEIIKSSGEPNKKINVKMLIAKNFARGIIVFSIGYLIYDLYVSENKARVIISHSATIGGGFVGGGLGMWAGLICGPYAFVCVPTFGGLGVVGGGYLGHTVVNEWFDDEINALLKEYNLD
ncbi:conserved hypothetical protein [Helicobacter cinaedi CCUG 18818 = ATCC BAA-847]|uniref:Uncharacterized protein n=2 Tax=Helicobacter cinaedi TaxID=213 RepID=A0AAI8MNA3_9HELI|nr:hypothetical protein [Helicobacter cinaedi]BAM32718.1 conserved hypothetical protein [Helicobacter cinaedi CCUG 18818 = ATCC BAA-847]